MEFKIEVVFVPVTDVDRAKAFYVDTLGLHCDMDGSPDADTRFVQVTPTGSACSFAFGRGIGSQMEPGSQQGIMAVVADADAALAQLRAAGVDAQGVDEKQWGRFVTFADPDGNGWTLQQLVPQG